MISVARHRAAFGMSMFCALGACMNAPTRGALDEGEDAGAIHPEGVGSISAELTSVPVGVQCVRMEATSASGTVSASKVVTGTSTDVSVNVGPLPFGTVALSGYAYDVACGSASAVPTWRSQPINVTITAENVTYVGITLHPYGPTEVDVGFKPIVEQVAMGESSTLVRHHDGRLTNFGSTSFTSGFLGLPPPVQGVFASQSIYCVTGSDRLLYCTGNNYEGMLGIGNTSTSFSTSTPTRVPTVSGVTKLEATWRHACAVTDTNGLYCWGSNDFGQVLVGSTVDQHSPVWMGGGMRDVAVSFDHTCRLSTAGWVFCNGNNDLGQLGNGTTGAPGSTNVGILNGVVALAGARKTTLALMADGTVKGWGAAGYGLLGTAVTGTSASTPTTIAGLSGVVAIAAARETACALTGSGDVYCWGDGQHGLIGNGATVTPVRTPVRVLRGASSIEAGTSSFCAVMDSGDLMCWGYNGQGQLGDGTSNSAFVPTRATAW